MGTSTPNWAGYVAGPGPFTAASGTFNVPNLVATSTQTVTSEWIGIDGVAPSTTLIQAGVTETYDPGKNRVSTDAWWEILPDDPRSILIPWSQLSVLSGHSVYVAISRISSTLWGLTVTDNSTGQTYTTDQVYTGGQATAEWIVEAPTDATTNTTDTLGDFSPPVTFTDARITGTQTTLDDLAMVQGGAQVAAPSAFVSGSFTVTYTGPTPTPTPTPTPAPTPLPTPTVYTITAGQSFSLTLTGGTPGLSAQWQVSYNEVDWSALANVTLDASGDSTYPFVPTQTAYYRTWYPALGRYGSWIIEVIVQPAATPTPTPTPTPGLQVATITLGQQFSLTVTGGTPFSQVQWKESADDVTWTVLTTVPLDASGGSTYTFAPTQTAYYRAYFVSLGEYGQNIIEVVVSAASPTPSASPSPPPPSGGVPPHSTAVPPAGLTQLSTTDWYGGPGLATSLGGAIVHVVATDGSGPVDYYRSLDGGLTFAPPVVLTAPGTYGYEPALASAADGLVIAAWTAPARPGVHGVMVTRSTDYGATWSTPTLVSSGDVRTSGAAVTSDGGRRVVVSWVDASGRVTVRLSLNGGASFGSPVRLGTALKGGGASLAFSNGTLIAVWQTPTRAVTLRRNRAGGLGSWTSPVTLDTAAVSGFSVAVAARGSAALVAYTVTASDKWRAALNVSTDQGAHWSERRLAPATSQGEGVGGIVVTGAGGLLLVTSRGNQVEAVPASSYGLSWGAPKRLSDPHFVSVPDAVAQGSRTLVLFWSSPDLTSASWSLHLARI